MIVSTSIVSYNISKKHFHKNIIQDMVTYYCTHKSIQETHSYPQHILCKLQFFCKPNMLQFHLQVFGLESEVPSADLQWSSQFCLFLLKKTQAAKAVATTHLLLNMFLRKQLSTPVAPLLAGKRSIGK